MTAVLPVPPSVAPRRATLRRDTKETKIGVSVDLDGVQVKLVGDRRGGGD